MADRTCMHCSRSLPDRCRSSKRFCDRHCAGAWDWATNPEKRLRARREWYQRTNTDRLAQARLRHTHKRCPVCDGNFPPGSNARRMFCSVKCKNKNSLTVDLAIRVETARRRRARLLAASSPGVSASDWVRLKNRHGHRCFYCREQANLTMDHVVPLSRGGAHSIGNILPACLSCNSSKRDRLIVEWIRIRPAQLPRSFRLATW